MILKIKNLTLVFILLASLGCCQGTGPSVTIQKSDGQELQISVEIADTPEKRAKGLMFRENVPEGTGMLFLFPKETQSSFWMKNTPSSLDILFLREGRIVSIIENTAPYSEELLTPDSSYIMVLEVTGGYANRHGVQLGDVVTTPGGQD